MCIAVLVVVYNILIKIPKNVECLKEGFAFKTLHFVENPKEKHIVLCFWVPIFIYV